MVIGNVLKYKSYNLALLVSWAGLVKSDKTLLSVDINISAAAADLVNNKECYSILNSLRVQDIGLYNKLKPFIKEIDMGSELGDIGFGD